MDDSNFDLLRIYDPRFGTQFALQIYRVVDSFDSFDYAPRPIHSMMVLLFKNNCDAPVNLCYYVFSYSMHALFYNVYY